MRINRENYEAYFIDYSEGNLDELLVNDFIEFLQKNPDLKEELSFFEAVSVEPDEKLFKQKEKLYKEKYDSETEFNQAAIANLEGDISKKEKTQFFAHLAKHPEKERDIVLFGKTKLHPDTSIVFGNKRKLYKQSGRKVFLLWTVRIAAVLVLAFAFFVLFERPTAELIPSEKIAKFEDKKEIKTTTEEVKEIPVEVKKEEPVKEKKSTIKPPVKTVAPKTPKTKSLREDTNGRMTHEDLAINRTPLVVPEKMNSITASLHPVPAKARMAVMYIELPENLENYNEEKLLADIVMEKTGLDKFEFNKITKAGLNIVTSISKEKFKYETDKYGKIINYNYDSRLVAFSIPTKRTKPE